MTQTTATPRGFCACCRKLRKLTDCGIFAPCWLCWACAVHRTRGQKCC